MSDAAELEREAEAARARLSDTADQIRAKMSPGQMMDEVLNQFRGGDGSQMFANLRGQARDNPMALALVGSGLAWLMMGSGSQGHARPSALPRPGPGPSTPTVRRRSRGSYAEVAGSYTGTRGSYAGIASGDRAETARPWGRPSLARNGARCFRRPPRPGTAVGDGLHAAGDRAERMAHDLPRRRQRRDRRNPATPPPAPATRRPRHLLRRARARAAGDRRDRARGRRGDRGLAAGDRSGARASRSGRRGAEGEGGRPRRPRDGQGQGSRWPRSTRRRATRRTARVSCRATRRSPRRSTPWFGRSARLRAKRRIARFPNATRSTRCESLRRAQPGGETVAKTVRALRRPNGRISPWSGCGS